MLKRKLAGLSILIAIAAISGCGKNPAESSRQIGSFNVEKLFTEDGCTVYRFKDDGRLHYFTNCGGSTMGHVKSGKSSRPETIQGGYTYQQE